MPRTDPVIGDGLWLPLVTPLRHGAPDLRAAQQLTAHYAGAGVDGLIVLGTTGEGGLLTEAERLMVTAAVLEVAQGSMPVMAGVGGVDTRSVCEQVRTLDRFDLAGYLVPPPYYLRVSDEGIAWHVRRVASQTARPLMLYNVPKRTGSTISPALALRLADHPQVVAIKECDRAGLRALAGQDALRVFCGEDAAMLDHLLAGGAGVVPAAAHIRPDLFVRLLQLARTGRDEAARAVPPALAADRPDVCRAEPRAGQGGAGAGRAGSRRGAPAAHAGHARADGTAGSHHGAAAACCFPDLSAFPHAHSDGNR